VTYTLDVSALGATDIMGALLLLVGSALFAWGTIMMLGLLLDVIGGILALAFETILCFGKWCIYWPVKKLVAFVRRGHVTEM